ncbi:MAG: hypothetical protein ACPLZY_03665, partial [Candidatus Norongarragalinales archaeon]
MYGVLHCRFSRKKLVCPYSEEERRLELCTVCKVARVTSQQDLIIKQNRVIIALLQEIRDTLQQRT